MASPKSVQYKALGRLAIMPAAPIKELLFLPNIRMVVSFTEWWAARPCGPCKCAPVCLQSHLQQRKNSRFLVTSPPLSIGAGLRRPGEVAPLSETHFCTPNFFLDENADPSVEPMSLYYRVVVIRAPLQGLCYNVRDAVDWFSRPTARRFQKGSNHSPLQYC